MVAFKSSVRIFVSFPISALRIVDTQRQRLLESDIAQNAPMNSSTIRTPAVIHPPRHWVDLDQIAVMMREILGALELPADLLKLCTHFASVLTNVCNSQFTPLISDNCCTSALAEDSFPGC
jgi:hypothetical protein